jgi:hypothetical protein
VKAAFVAVVAAAAGACGGTEPSSPDAALRELTVSVLERHHTPEGIVDVRLGGAVDRVFARQADGSFVAGPPDYLEPTGDPPAYRVPVPAGEVYLVLHAGGFQYDLVVGAPDRVVADRATYGRPLRDLNVQPVAIAVDGALPWDVGDDLVVTCPALVTRAYLSSGEPPPGTSAITGTSQGWQGADYRADRGDVVYVLQRRQETVGDVRYLRVVRSLAVGPLGARDGLATIEGTLAAPRDAALALDVRLSELATRVGVAPGELTASVELEVRPFGAGNPTGVVVPREILMFINEVSADVAVTLPYGNPYPAEWPVVLSLRARSEITDYALPGTPPVLTGPFASSTHTLAGGLVAPAPLLGAPVDVRVEGVPPSADIVDVPGAPVLSWGAPASGTADGYVVEIYRLFVDGDERPYTSIYETVRLHTVATSVRVPPGLLDAGEVYYATVAAVAGASPGDVDVLARPFEIAGTTAVAGALSVRFRTGP